MGGTYKLLLRGILVAAVTYILSVGNCPAQWSELAPMDQNRASSMSVWLDGKLYVFGGANSLGTLKSAQVFDSLSGQWSPIADLPDQRYGGYATAVNGRIYIIGGYSGATLLSAVWEYDPATNRYAAKDSMPQGIVFGAGATIGTRIYIMAGMSSRLGSLTYNDSVYRYDVINNRWSKYGSPPYMAQSPVVTVINGTIYFVGGYNTTSGLSKAYQGVVWNTYIKWTQIPDYPSPIYRGVCGSLGGQLYVAGGYTEGNVKTRAVFRYDSTLSQWTHSYSLPVPLVGGSTSMPNDGRSLYYVGGENSQKLMRFNEESQRAIAVVGKTRFSLVLKTGEGASRTCYLYNDGVVPLTINLEIPSNAQSWLRTDASSVSIKPGDSASISLEFSAAGVPEGEYRTALLFHTNDSSNALISIDVRLFVRDLLLRQRTNIVVEDASASWCCWCVYADDTLALLKREFPDNAIVVAYHGPDSRDSLRVPGSEELVTLLGHNDTWPYASVQRRIFPREVRPMMPMDYGRSVWNQRARDVLRERPTAPVAIEVEKYAYNPTTNDLSAHLRLTTSDLLLFDSLHRYRVTVVVVQDSIIYRQSGFDIQNHGCSIGDYSHNDVARIIWPDPKGSELTVSGGMVVDSLLLPGTVLEKDVAFTVQNVSNPRQSSVVIIVHEFNNGELGEILQGYKFALREPTLLVTREYSERTIGLHDTARFHAIVKNMSSEPRQISLTRRVNDLPSALWQSWFCVNGVCLAPGGDTASAFLLPPGDSARVDLYVRGGTAGKGNVRLHIANDDGERSDAEFTVTTLSTSSANEAEASRGGLWLSQNVPNPASGRTAFIYRIPSAGRVTMDLFTPVGEQVLSQTVDQQAPGDHLLGVDVSHLPTGTYVARLSAGRNSVSRLIIIVR